jgi:hypothetical protein
MLAADNARLCGIALAADELARALRAWLDGDGHDCAGTLYPVLEAYEIVRNGS